MEDFILKLNEALDKNETVIFSTNCSITYSGRAESFLPFGDRLIIIKQDGTLLVHQPKGNTPINYMKEGTSHTLEKKDQGIFLKSRNLLLKEYLDVNIKKIYFIHTQSMLDDQKLQLNGTERDMADMLYQNPEMVEKGFKPLSMEEHTKYGFIDLFGYDEENNLVVVECKRYAGDLKAASQLRRYVEKVRKSKGMQNVRGILAAPKISPNAKRMLEDWNFSFLKINPPKYLERYDKGQKRINEF